MTTSFVFLLVTILNSIGFHVKKGKHGLALLYTSELNKSSHSQSELVICKLAYAIPNLSQFYAV